MKMRKKLKKVVSSYSTPSSTNSSSDSVLPMAVVATGVESKRVVEALLGDLRALSQEARKKHNHVKEAAEAGVVKVRNISTGSTDASLLQNLRTASVELLHPLVLGCATKNARLVQISLQGIQRLVQHRILEPASAPVVVNELWSLMEADCEELRVLQTITPFVSTELLVTGTNLAKCIVMCFRMNFAKDPIVINAASAAVRQLVGCVFERVIQEDGLKSGELSIVSPTGKSNVRAPPPTLRPCAADGYMLFRDLCLLINAEQSMWLQGIQEMTRTLGLELLETVLRCYPSIFFKHSEFAALLKEEVCPLVIKLFSPNLKHIQISSQHPSHRVLSSSLNTPNSPDRPYFPIAMRLVRVLVQLIGNYHKLLATECEIFLSLLNKFLESDKLEWQRALSLEALHKLLSQPSLLSWLVENFDTRSSSSKVCENTLKGLDVYLKNSFRRTHLSSGDEESDSSSQFGVPGFFHNGTWIPLVEGLTARKGVLLECLDKHEAPPLLDGYCVSRGSGAVADTTQTVFAAVDGIAMRMENAKEGGSAVPEGLDTCLFSVTYPSLLSSLSLLLEASTDESTTESLLSCLSTLCVLACRLKDKKASDACFYALCSSALPGHNYLEKFASITVPEVLRDSHSDGIDSSSSFHQVVATGTPCPYPSINNQLANTQVMLTAKNLQCFRVLIGSLTTNSPDLGQCWYMCLCTCQHVCWLLAMKPNQSGLYTKSSGDDVQSGSSSNSQSSSTSTVTTAAKSDIPVLSSMLDKLFESSSKLDDVALHHLVDALCTMSSEAMTVAQGAREPSFFPISKLLHIGMANLSRMETYWKPLTHHLIEICSHSFAPLRDWAAVALTTIVKTAFREKTQMDDEKRQHLVFSPLSSLSDIDLMDVRRRQMDCLMAVIQSEGSMVTPSLWSTIIDIIGAIVDPRFSFPDSLVKHAYLSLRLVAADFLQQLPYTCLEQLVEADKRYGQQQAEQNISLSALAQLWTISDFVFRRSEAMGADAAEKVWLVLYNCLSELCVDIRPPVRKSACQTLLQTIAAHGQAMRVNTWKHMIWQILMPMLDKVRSITRSASTERTSSPSMLIHHSRDTELKQWTETCIHTMQAMGKIVNAQRSILVQLDDFDSAWETLLSYIEWAASTDNAELSLAAIKCFQEVLLGKVSAQTLDINTKEKSTVNLKETTTVDEVPFLPQKLWLVSWKSWLRIARSLVTVRSQPEDPKERPYIPGPSHLTTLLHIFVPLFERVKKDISVDECKYDQLPSVFESLSAVPIPSDQSPFVLTVAGGLTPTQEAIIDCVKAVYTEMSSSPSVLRLALPDIIRLLLKFSSLCAHPPPRQMAGNRDYTDWALQHVVPFGEISLRTAVDFYSSTAHYKENVEGLILVDIVKTCADPLSLKYRCISSTSWKLTASALLNVLRIGLPIARQHGPLFTSLWPILSSTIEHFLFTPNNCSSLNPDERKRDEFVDCQFIDLLRTEILPHIHVLPSQFVQQIISLLNRGSICNLDPTDVLASESYTQRVELSRACFDALLSMSREDGSQATRDANATQQRDRLGQAAIASLLDRCKQVLSSFTRDCRGSGDMRLPSSRVAESVASLQAIDTLIERLAGRSDGASSSLYSQLVSLHPTLVDVVPCCHTDPQIESSLVSALKSYQTLLLLKSIPLPNHMTQ